MNIRAWFADVLVRLKGTPDASGYEGDEDKHPQEEGEAT